MQGDSEVPAAGLAPAQSSPRDPGLPGLALFSADPFSGRQEPFDLCFVGFNRVDYADVSGKKHNPRLCPEGPQAVPAGSSKAGL